jgi:AraC family transcriptional regulator of arabinose operon
MYHFELLGYWGNSDANLYECGVHQCDPSFAMDERFLRKNDIIHMIVSGKGTFRIGKQSHQLSAGQGFYIPAYTPAFYQADEQDPWMYCWIIFGGVKLNEYLHAAHIDRRNPAFLCPDPQSYWAHISNMLDQCVNKDAFVEPRLFAHCHEIFAKLIYDNAQRASANKADFRMETYVEKAISYMQENLGAPIRMTDVAAMVGLNPNYFCTVFEHYIGRSPQNYLITLRMQQARTMLLSTMDSIQRIASLVGYQSLSAFSKAFAKQVGVSPKDYRLMYFEGRLTSPGQLPPKPPFHKRPEGE